MQHLHSIRTSGPASRTQTACDGVYLAAPCRQTTVAVWELHDITSKPLELVGHRKPVTALCFSHHHQGPLLCSCAADYVIAWDIEKARSAFECGQQVRGSVIGQLLGDITYCSLSYDDSKLAICVSTEVHVLDIQKCELIYTLEGHIAPVSCAEFCPHYGATLVSAAEDRTFKIWDISSGVLVYQSTIISSSPFSSLSMDPAREQFTLGTLDGQLRVYDLSDGNGFRMLHHLDVDRMVAKLREAGQERRKRDDTKPEGPVTISSQPSWLQQQDTAPAQDGDEEVEDSEVGCAILGLQYWCHTKESQASSPRHLPLLRQTTGLVDDLLANTVLLALATTGAVLVIDARSLEPAAFYNLQEPISSLTPGGQPVSLSLIGTAGFAVSPSTNKLFCTLGGLFVNEMHIVTMTLPTSDLRQDLHKQLSSSASMPVILSGESPQAEPESTTGSEEFTVLSSTPLSENSPLRAEMVMKLRSTDKQPSKRASWAGFPSKHGGLDKKGQIVDNQPITFKSSVKSSGYSTVPRKTMFRPQTNNSTKSTPTKKKLKSPSTEGLQVKEYPVESDIPSVLHRSLDVAERATAIHSVKFSDDGHSLLCALANKSAQVFNLPLTGKGYAFTGHNGSVTSANWSRDGKWLLTSSDDRTACVWSTSLSDSVMTFKTIKNNQVADKEGLCSPTKDNPAFSKEVKFAQFYYMDRFILLTSGNMFYLYKYNLDMAKSDIKRYLSNNKYKMVEGFKMSQAQGITGFSAVNSFYSYIVLAAGSNKCMEVFDMNKGQSIRMVPDIHTRPAHIIAQNEGSAYVTHPPHSYDLFATAAASDCIKLWDLRTSRCVQRYASHTNRVRPCGLAFSPCSKFLATGAEDRCAYVYDIRTGTHFQKLVGHTETVSDVAFHPVVPQLVTASLDGKLRLYKTQ